MAAFDKDASNVERLQKELETVMRSIQKLERGRLTERAR